MRSIRIDRVAKTYRGETIFENISLTIPAGKFFALLGPSGCGKTTLLRLIGGFEKVDSGRIFLGEQDITDMPINKRSVNTIFQSYALFPHLTVYDNVAYGPRVKGKSEEYIAERVGKILSSFGLQAHLQKPISELSGGQQQRVAIARAIINEPEVLLLDEPLAALDFKLREKMLIELIELQDKLKTTFVYVTHDQFEALTVADQMAIMNENGEIEQVGTPKEIYEFPVSSFVANFVGTSNIMQGTLHTQSDDVFTFDIEGLGSSIVQVPRKQPWMIDGTQALLSVRPEKFFIARRELPTFANKLSGIVSGNLYHGRSTQYNVRLKNGMTVQVFEQNEEHFPQDVIDYDHEVFLHWQKENAVVIAK